MQITPPPVRPPALEERGSLHPLDLLIAFSLPALYPDTEGMPGVGFPCALRFARQVRKEAHPLFWLGAVSGAVTFCATPILTLGLPLPAFLLSRRLLDRHARVVAGHRWYLVRQAIFLLKLMAGLAWGSDLAVRRHLELPPYPEDSGGWVEDTETPAGLGGVS